MNDLAINNVLAQIRAMSTQAATGVRALSASNPNNPVNGSSGADFSQTLTSALKSVSASQTSAADLATRFELGDDKVDLSQVMLAGARAQVSFRAAVEVRNRLVSAYQDVMNMPI